MMSQYKPMLIRFDERSYKEALSKASEKESLWREAISWIKDNFTNWKQPTDSAELNTLHNSFTEYFRDKYWETNKDLVKLPISIDKILDLMEIDIRALSYIEREYKAFDYKPKFNTGEISFPVDKTPFEMYTRSSEENQKLKLARKFIDILEEVSEVTHVYHKNIQTAVSNFVIFDMRENRFFANVIGRSN